MDWVVELELAVGDDFTSTTVLIGEDTILQRDDGIGGADGLTLGGDRIGVGDVVRSDFKGTGEILIAAVGSLTGDGRG